MKKEKKDFASSEKDEDVNTENMTNNQEIEPNESENCDNMADDKKEMSLEEKYLELNNSYLRLHAEFDNYRKRTIKEKADLLKTAGEAILIGLLPVVDDFERALDNIEKTDSIDSIKEGVELIHGKFASFLSKNHVTKMNAIGEAFDLELHEAITTIPAESEEMKDKIVDCIQHGYTLGDKVIRFPKVIVAK